MSFNTSSSTSFFEENNVSITEASELHDLQQKMLDYVCENEYFEESLFNYPWMWFKRDVVTDLTPSDLKQIFHCEVLQRLENFALSDEWRDYLSIKMEDPRLVLPGNEPKKDVDYKMMDGITIGGEDSVDNLQEDLKENKKYKGNFNSLEGQREEDQSALHISKLNIEKEVATGVDRDSFNSLVSLFLRPSDGLALKDRGFDDFYKENKKHWNFLSAFSNNSEVRRYMNQEISLYDPPANENLENSQQMPLPVSKNSMPSVPNLSPEQSGEGSGFHIHRPTDSSLKNFVERFKARVPPRVYKK